MTSDTPLFQRWLLAQASAARAEQEFFRAHVSFARGEGLCPPEGWRAYTEALRVEASRLFGLALAEMEVRARIATLRGRGFAVAGAHP